MTVDVFLDPAQMPNQSQDQLTFDTLMALFMQNLPTFGAQFNASLAQFNVGLAGGAYALPYVFDTATADADPTAGKLRLSSATQNAATVLRLDVLAGGIDMSSIIDTFDASTSTVKGSIRLVKMGDQSKFLTFSVTARATPSGYRNLSITNTGGSSANPFANGDPLLLFFTRTGDKGDVGSLNSLVVRDEKASGTNAGQPGAQGGWVTRTLNAVPSNTIVGASLAGNAITLPAGTYEYDGSAPAYSSNSHVARLFNNTDGTVIDMGTAEMAYTSGSSTTRSLLRGQFTLSATKSILVQHYFQQVNGVSFGIAVGTGGIEVYTEIRFKKVA